MLGSTSLGRTKMWLLESLASEFNGQRFNDDGQLLSVGCHAPIVRTRLERVRAWLDTKTIAIL